MSAIARIYEVNNCTRCPALCAARSQIVNGVGKANAPIMFVGQNPGVFEDKDGVPFVGKSGQLLALMCDAAGIPRGSIYRTNAVRCFSPGNRKPKREEVENCRDYLIEEILEVNPAVIVTLGDTALQALCALDGGYTHNTQLQVWQNKCDQLQSDYDEALLTWMGAGAPRGQKPAKPKLPLKPRRSAPPTTTIKDVAGHTLTQRDTGIPLIPTYHPAYLMRGKWEQCEQVIAHLAKAKRVAEGEQKVGSLGEYAVIDTFPKLEALRDYLLSDAVDTIWFDTETTGIHWMTDELLCISFAGRPGEGFVVPVLMQNKDGDTDIVPSWGYRYNRLVRVLQEIFGSDKPKGGQNIIFDLRFLERKPGGHIEAVTAFGIEVNGPFKDTMLAHHAVAESQPHGMTTNLALWTDMPFYEQEVKKYKKAMALAPNNIIWPYSAADADGLPRLWEPIRKQVETEEVDFALDNITMPLIRVCRNIEDRGFPIDRDYFDRLCKFYGREIEKAEAALWKIVPTRPPGWKYNYAPTLREVLFKDLGLPPSGRKTDSGHGCQDCSDGVCFEHDQTGKDALKDIQASNPHPALDVIITLKNLTKRKSVYLDGGRGGLLRYIRLDGRVHSSMKIGLAETGRLASEEPNSQNIPNYVHIHPLGHVCADSECKANYDETFGINTDNAFHDLVRAPDGHGIMNVDWSQLEIWVLAYRLFEDFGDRTLLEVLESGTDIHLWMARQMYPNIDPDLDDKAWRAAHPDLRRRAKMANFGIGYGLTEQGFVLRERCSPEEAREAIERYKSIVPIDLYFKSIRNQLFRYRAVEDWAGRRRHILHLAILKAMGELGDMEAAIREGINMPIQAGGSDLHSVASAATDALNILQKRGCYAIMSVHDSLTFEFGWPDNEYAVQTAWIIKNLWTDIAWNTLRSNGSPLHWRVPSEVEWGQTLGTPTFKIEADGTFHPL